MNLPPLHYQRQEGALILVVDDNLENLRLLGSILELKGYKTVMALNAGEAFDFLREGRPELILLDIMMPEMDGFAAAKKIRGTQELKGIPIIFLTARNETEDIVRGFEAGAVDYITKPFNPPELLARIRTHIELKRARDEIRTLHGIVPICANCKKIRDEQGTWHAIETYIKAHSEADFTHGVCPDCVRKLYPKIAKQVLSDGRKGR